MKRYRVMFPVDIGTLPGSSDDLVEAGRIYLATPGASDIWDAEANDGKGGFIDPLDSPPVLASYERWHKGQ